jgi:hypothetical protein
VLTEFENILTEVGQIIQTVTKCWNYVFTYPSSFMVCIEEIVSISGCEDGVGTCASEYGSMV